MCFQTKDTWYTSSGVPCKEPCDPSRATFTIGEHDNVQLIHKKTGEQVIALR